MAFEQFTKEEYDIGETITVVIKLKVVEDDDCNGCFFDYNCDGFRHCAGRYRTDKKSVKFVEIKEDD